MTRGPGGREGELDAQAVAALRAFRAEEDMPAPAQARVWARVAASASADEALSKRHVSRRRSEWAWAALVVAAAAAVLLASRAGVLGPLSGARDGGEAAAYSERREAATEPVRAGEGGPIEHVVQDMVRETATPDAGEEVAPAPEVGESAGPAKSEPRPRSRAETMRSPSGASPAAADEGSSPTTSSSLAQEAEALARAQAAIQGGRADEALAVLAAYAQQFPHGVLREEHDALRALALCASDRAAEGRAAAAVFLRTHGASALAERVRQGCAEE
ncbi:hypothetical protein [Nannocystis sp. SCPEA4]|uniref:hypothetical protein n=1 Tax=Nannocystis sp. SCPEA4 TaxID=2996787 RepID=UPI0022703DD6|nr:hypothetical protein [Nannocystis sp. SCPEA4]MCY1054364.1 hypothetical protein [Nannocystis sp. SCPEA4]